MNARAKSTSSLALFVIGAACTVTMFGSCTGDDGQPTSRAHRTASASGDQAPATGDAETEPAGDAASGPACLGVDNYCDSAADCCEPLTCARVGSLADPLCCVGEGSACQDHVDCCGDALCDGPEGGETCSTCGVPGTGCHDSNDCCYDLACNGGTCG